MYDDIEALVAAMERDELADATCLSPRDFAKTIGVSPQLVYYYIRTGKIKGIVCQCGRKVINVDEARTVFESRGTTVDKRSDEERAHGHGEE